MLPQEVKKQIDNIKAKDASNKLLVTVLLIAVMVLFGMCVKLSSGNNANSMHELELCRKEKEEILQRGDRLIERNDLLRKENDSLRNDSRVKAEKEAQRLSIKMEWQDSIINSLKNIINHTKK